MTSIGAVGADPVRILVDFLYTCLIEVLQTETTVLLVAGDMQLFLKRFPSLLILNKLLKQQTVHLLTQMPLSIVNLHTIHLNGGWIDHLIAQAVEVALGKDHCSLVLLAVVAEL